jgi:hypothetical protein
MEPGILPILTTPSIHLSLTWFAPSMFSTIASTSLFSLRGVLTLVNASSSELSVVAFFLCSDIPLLIRSIILGFKYCYVSFVVKCCVHASCFLCTGIPLLGIKYVFWLGAHMLYSLYSCKGLNEQISWHFSSWIAVDCDGHNLYIESTSIVKIPVEIWWNTALSLRKASRRPPNMPSAQCGHKV